MVAEAKGVCWGACHSADGALQHPGNTAGGSCPGRHTAHSAPTSSSCITCGWCRMQWLRTSAFANWPLATCSGRSSLSGASGSSWGPSRRRLAGAALPAPGQAHAWHQAVCQLCCSPNCAVQRRRAPPAGRPRRRWWHKPTPGEQYLSSVQELQCHKLAAAAVLCQHHRPKCASGEQAHLRQCKCLGCTDAGGGHGCVLKAPERLQHFRRALRTVLVPRVGGQVLALTALNRPPSASTPAKACRAPAIPAPAGCSQHIIRAGHQEGSGRVSSSLQSQRG